MIQRRKDASRDFFLDWNSYKEGFGDLTGNFWLGNDALNELTTQHDYQLRIELESYNSGVTYAKYRYFKVGDEADNYRLNVSQFRGSYKAGKIRKMQSLSWVIHC